MSATFINQSRNSATFENQLRHGVEPTIGDMADKTFNDPLYPSGDDIKDLTFQELQNQSYTNQTRNSASFTNISRN